MDQLARWVHGLTNYTWQIHYRHHMVSPIVEHYLAPGPLSVS